MKENRRNLIIIFVISFLIIVILFYVCFNKLKSNNNIKLNDTEKSFIYGGSEYKVPSGYEYLESDKLFLIFPTSKEKWISQVVLHYDKPLTNVDEVYDQIEKSPNFIEHTLKKDAINGTNILIYKYAGMKKIIVDFFTPSGNFCQIFVNYETDEFNVNVLAPVIESINNSIDLNKKLKDNNTSTTTTTTTKVVKK